MFTFNKLIIIKNIKYVSGFSIRLRITIKIGSESLKIITIYYYFIKYNNLAPNPHKTTLLLLIYYINNSATNPHKKSAPDLHKTRLQILIKNYGSDPS